jgi:hypothetical protein
MRRWLVLICFFSLFASVAPAQAASNEICFQQVPDCLTFRFASFWRDNGGLAVFGLPLSPAKNEQVGDQKYKVQYLERARFELHKENAKPYDVLLGRLGVDALVAQGRDWQTFPKADPAAAHYFAQTGHAIAPQFWGFWSRNGLEFDGNKRGKSLPESLALFGYPVSEPQMEQAADGQMYLTQWFERAKFEYHPENKAPYDVLLGRLGADVYAAAQQSPNKPGNNTPAKVIGCAPNAPDAAEGAQAWVADAEPQAPGTANAVCARLIVNGAPVAGAEVKAHARYSDAEFTYGPATTGADGQAQIDFNIDKAKNRFVVVIDVTFTAPDGRTFTASTNFRPHYAYADPPQPSGDILPNIPMPTGGCALNAPQPTEGAHAWVTVTQPADPNQFSSICARLIVNGAPVAGAEVNAIAYRYGKDAYYGPATTGADGVAEIGFPIDGAKDRYTVYIDVSLKAPDGKTYVTTTYYRPKYPNAQ